MKLQKLCVLAVGLSIAGCSEIPTQTSQVDSQTTVTSEKTDLQQGPSPETDGGDAKKEGEDQDGGVRSTDSGSEGEKGDSGQRFAGTGNGQGESGGFAGRGRGRAGGFDPSAIFERRDANGDGQLTDDEISERMRGNLQQFDSDSDGAITLEEFKNGMSQRFGRGGGSGRFGGGSCGNPREGRPNRPERPEFEE